MQSPSWEANWSAASQEISRILLNPKVHYRTHKRPPPVPILGQRNPVHIPTSHLLEIHPNIIHPSTPRSPQWSLSLRFPHQDPIRPPLHTHTRHMPSPSHSSRFYHPHNIGWGVQTDANFPRFFVWKNTTSFRNLTRLIILKHWTNFKCYVNHVKCKNQPREGLFCELITCSGMYTQQVHKISAYMFRHPVGAIYFIHRTISCCVETSR